MKKKKKILLYVLLAAGIGVLLYFIFRPSYVPSEYGPIKFEITMKPDPDAEAYGYEPTFVNGQTEVEFSPEDAGIVRDEINALRLKHITFKTDYKDGFDAFDHITVTINSDETETIDVGSFKIEPGTKDSLVIEGREEGEVPDFKNIKKFRLLVTLNIKEGYKIEENVNFTGNMMLNVMVVENDKNKAESEKNE